MSRATGSALAAGFRLFPRSGVGAAVDREVRARDVGCLGAGDAQGKAPTIDVVVGYHKANASPILAKFISRLGDLIERATKHVPR